MGEREQAGRRIGQTLGGYRLDALLGVGGMAEVYRAHELRLGRDVAVKILRATVADDPAALVGFRDEARRLAALTHPNITPIYHFGEDDDALYIVMPVMWGSLRTLLRQEGHLTPLQARVVIAQVAAGLGAAHAIGVIHGDVKPGNILLDVEGNALLTDFGVARTLAAAEATARHSGAAAGPAHNAPERPQLIVGTPLYMAPEQLTGSPSDQRTDLYALGAVLYETLTGQPPHNAETPEGVLALKLTRPASAPSTVVDGVPADLDTLTLKALATDPAARFPDARAFSAALRLGALASDGAGALDAVEAARLSGPLISPLITPKFAPLSAPLASAGAPGGLAHDAPTPVSVGNGDLRMGETGLTQPADTALMFPPIALGNGAYGGLPQPTTPAGAVGLPGATPMTPRYRPAPAAARYAAANQAHRASSRRMLVTLVAVVLLILGIALTRLTFLGASGSQGNLASPPNGGAVGIGATATATSPSAGASVTPVGSGATTVPGHKTTTPKPSPVATISPTASPTSGPDASPTPIPPTATPPAPTATPPAGAQLAFGSIALDKHANTCTGSEVITNASASAIGWTWTTVAPETPTNLLYGVDASATTPGMPTSAGVPANGQQTLNVSMDCSGGASYSVTVTDSQGNTYTITMAM